MAVSEQEQIRNLFAVENLAAYAADATSVRFSRVPPAKLSGEPYTCAVGTQVASYRLSVARTGRVELEAVFGAKNHAETCKMLEFMTDLILVRCKQQS